MVSLNPAANYEAHCEVFFKCTETLNPDGSGSMVDSIHGCTWTPSIGGVGYSLTNQPGCLSNALFSVALNPQSLSAGTFPTFGERPIILFGCGRIVDKTKIRIPIGDGSSSLSGTSGLVSLSNDGSMHTIVNSGTGGGAQLASSGGNPLRSASIPDNGADVGIIVEWTPQVGVVAKIVDLNGNTFGSGEAETRITVATGFPAPGYEVNPGLNNKTRFGGLAWYSIVAFSFPQGSALPDNREAAYRWMLANHSAGNRTLPPQWSYSTPAAYP